MSTSGLRQPVPSDPREWFAAHLRELRRSTLHMPTEEALARKVGCARSTVSAILNGRRFPSWEHTQALVRACGDDPALWRERWLEARRRIDEQRQSAAKKDPLPGVPGVTGTAMLSVQWYRDNREFYEAATEQVNQARSEIRLTYARRYPPTAFATRASADYFDSVLRWASEESEDERCVRRIIGIPEQDGLSDPDVLEWAGEHYAGTKHILNDEANVLRWTAAADLINMALIDDGMVFLAFSGGPRQKLNGLRGRLGVACPQCRLMPVRLFVSIWAPWGHLRFRGRKSSGPFHSDMRSDFCLV
ncbi:helix-turn-helix transcriptional regulator [Actinomadura sp. 6K520]|uniref:helix-turn-helix transcriptional regulator n=1 Tax=Actinomadura sp. 6K520 TaxID=2530364 RepID=UPI0010462850|nr:helix-turn-helix transcriptional regulator [Actinomadura sp. 6K520]TDE32815.1 XRE family transcriptional regulator [Actinomadura sp. 6K520]